MFRWLTDLFRSYTVEDVIEELAPGHKHRMACYHREQEAQDAQRSGVLERENKKWHLEQELQDAKWIIEYERKLAALEKEVAEESRCATKAGRSPERLLKLNQHLARIRDSLSG